MESRRKEEQEKAWSASPGGWSSRTPVQEDQDATGKGPQEGHGASPEQADVQNKGQRQGLHDLESQPLCLSSTTYQLCDLNLSKPQLYHLYGEDEKDRAYSGAAVLMK